MFYRLGSGQSCLGAVHHGLVNGRIYLVEQLTGSYLTAFRKQPLLDNAVHLGPNFSNPESRSPSGQFHRTFDQLRLDGDHIDLDRHRCALHLRLLLLAAAKEQTCKHHNRGHTNSVLYYHVLYTCFILIVLVHAAFAVTELSETTLIYTFTHVCNIYFHILPFRAQRAPLSDYFSA